MRIPERFSRLSNATLVVAAGAFDARLYLLQNGAMVGDEEMRKDEPAYSDREGFFARRGRGQVLGSGAVQEDKQSARTRRELLKDLGRHIRELAGREAVERVLLFAPAEHFPETKAALPAALLKKVAYEAKGNYSKHGILDLLRMAEGSFQENGAAQRRSLARDEVRGLLRRGRAQA